MAEENTGLKCAWCLQLLDDAGIEAFNGSMACDTCGPDAPEIQILCRNKDCPKYNKIIYKK